MVCSRCNTALDPGVQGYSLTVHRQTWQSGEGGRVEVEVGRATTLGQLCEDCFLVELRAAWVRGLRAREPSEERTTTSELAGTTPEVECSLCGGAIPQQTEHYALELSHEFYEEDGAISVLDGQLVSIACSACAAQMAARAMVDREQTLTVKEEECSC